VFPSLACFLGQATERVRLGRKSSITGKFRRCGDGWVEVESTCGDDFGFDESGGGQSGRRMGVEVRTLHERFVRFWSRGQLRDVAQMGEQW
jgi:hypothetical protein